MVLMAFFFSRLPGNASAIVLLRSLAGDEALGEESFRSIAPSRPPSAA